MANVNPYVFRPHALQQIFSTGNAKLMSYKIVLKNKGTGRSTGSAGNIEMLHPLTNFTLTGARIAQSV
jgi:hypothetical protein